MEHGIPWRRAISKKKACVIAIVVYGWLGGMKWAYLENQSNTVKKTAWNEVSTGEDVMACTFCESMATPSTEMTWPR
jgi:hypothetical protein